MLRDGSQDLPFEAGRLVQGHPVVPASTPGLATSMSNSLAHFDQYMESDD